MSVLYLHTTPPPHLEGTDAVHQEVDLLIQRFEGQVINLFPFQHPLSLPGQYLHSLRSIIRILRAEKRTQINHIFSPVLSYYAVFHLMKNPLIYSVIANVGAEPPKRLAQMRRFQRIIVSNERDRDQLTDWGFTNHLMVRTGLDLSTFSYGPFPLSDQITLLMASAPWVRDQFESKGINLLLRAAARLPNLRLIFLWRGLLLEDLQRMVKHYQVSDRVEIINEKVDVNNILARVHGSILLARHGGIVKAYPHSLLESLAAGKPVILSQTIPMSDYVSNQECGVVVKDYNLDSVIQSISELMSKYRTLTSNTQPGLGGKFSKDQMLNNLAGIYQSILNG